MVPNDCLLGHDLTRIEYAEVEKRGTLRKKHGLGCSSSCFVLPCLLLGHAKSSLPNTLRFLYLLISFPRYTLDLYIYVSRNITRRREFVSIRIFFFFFSLIFLYGIKKILVSIPLIPPIHAVVTL